MRPSLRTLAIAAAAQAATITVDQGKRARVLSVSFGVTPTPGQAEQATVSFSRGSTILARAGSGPCGDNVSIAHAGIGQTDPVASGSNASVLPFSLPDIWWQWNTVVTIGFTLTPPAAGGTIVYELDDL